jgi:plastocyanin
VNPRRRRLRRGAPVLAGLAVAAAALTGCHDGQTSTKPNVPGAQVVVLKNVMFNPMVLTVKVGTTVDWKWDDSGVDHDVISVGHGPLHSPLRTGGDYDYTFTTPGTYPYACSIHPGMVGQIVVTG